MIESWKDAPKIHELYEQVCQTSNQIPYSNVKFLLKESESNFQLDLNSISNNLTSNINQFEIIFDSIKLGAKQQFINNEYFVNLSKINLSSNMIIDQTAIHFFDAIYFECQSLKELNLSNNLMTTKSLKAICDIGVKYKNRPSLMVIFIL